MKRKVVLRAMMGIPLGIALGYLITIVISLIWGEGRYLACTPGLTGLVGSEVAAVTVQAALCGALGASFGACSLIWEMERWSLLKQSAVYFGITALVMLPMAWLCGWMQHSLAGFAAYTAIFAGIFAVIWLAQYLRLRKKVRGMDRRVREEN